MISVDEEELDVEYSHNGLFLINTFIPEEILVNILIFVDWKDLLSCRLVCCNWRRIVDSVICFEKLKIFSYKRLCSSFTCPISKLQSEVIPFHLYYAIHRGSFGKNLLKNPFGSGTSNSPNECQNRRTWRDVLFNRQRRIRIRSESDHPKFRYWNITQSLGNGWIVEKEPVGSEPLPEHLEGRSCFVTSFGWCVKEQTISLADCGLSPKIMDEIKPEIEVSEWYARRWDCGVIYKLMVSLLNNNLESVEIFEIETGQDLIDNTWHQVSHTFKDYGPGVRYVLFQHAGKDTQYWAGHYGSKMAGGSVIARIPSSSFMRTTDNS